jgi:hypothetical protein
MDAQNGSFHQVRLRSRFAFNLLLKRLPKPVPPLGFDAL